MSKLILRKFDNWTPPCQCMKLGYILENGKVIVHPKYKQYIYSSWKRYILVFICYLSKKRKMNFLIITLFLLMIWAKDLIQHAKIFKLNSYSLQRWFSLSVWHSAMAQIVIMSILCVNIIIIVSIFLEAVAKTT